MNENCRDCVYIETLTKRVTELEKDVENIKHDIVAIKQTNAKFEEKFDRIFEAINDIRKAVSKIADKIDEIEKRPATNWDKVITALISGAVAFLVSNILRRWDYATAREVYSYE